MHSRYQILKNLTKGKIYKNTKDGGRIYLLILAGVPCVCSYEVKRQALFVETVDHYINNMSTPFQGLKNCPNECWEVVDPEAGFIPIDFINDEE